MQTKTRSIVPEIIAALLLLLFLYTAVSKLMGHQHFVGVLYKSPLLTNFAEPVAWLVPLTEAVIALSLFVPAWRLYGFRLSYWLMMLFTLYIGYMLLFTPDLPCSCGGVISKMSWGQHLVFNLFFTAISFWGLQLQKKKTCCCNNAGIAEHLYKKVGNQLSKTKLNEHEKVCIGHHCGGAGTEFERVYNGEDE